MIDGKTDLGVKVLKLVDGEMLVAKTVRKGQEYIITKPMQVIVQRDPGGGMGVGIGEFLPFTKSESFPISANHVIFIDDPDDQMVQAYNSQTSAIELAPAGALSQLG